MDKETMMTNLQEHQYTGDGSFGLSAMYFAFGNPITDSMVVNAYAKTNKAAFQMALNTGVYGNHTVMGGNFLYNTLNNNRFTGKLFKNAKTGSWQPFAKIKGLNKMDTLRNFSLNFISSGDIDKAAGKGIAEIAEKTGLSKTSEIIRTGWGFGKDYSEFFKTLREMGYDGKRFDAGVPRYSSTVKEGNKVIRNVSYDALEWSAKNLSDDMTETILRASDEKVIKLADEFIKLGGKLSNYTVGSKTITKEVREELIEKAGKFFATRTTFQKIISSPLVRIATGAAIALPASVSLPLMIATTGIGMAASMGQENAINNFINSHLYNTNQYDQYSSAEATSSIYSAAQIRNVNLQALANSYQNINVANRYLNDMDPISSDYSYKLDDTETM